MAVEPGNAASELARRNETLLNDRDDMLRDGLSMCTEDFVRYDRRRMTAQPPADRQGWLDAMITFEGLAGGHGTVDPKPKGIMAVVFPLLRPMIRRDMSKQHQHFKALCESQAQSPSA